MVNRIEQLRWLRNQLEIFTAANFAIKIYTFKISLLQPSQNEMLESESKDNPFQTPQLQEDNSPRNSNSDDTIGNLRLVSKVVRVSSIACGVGAMLCLYLWWEGFDYLYAEWSWLYAIHVYRIVYVIAFALLAWRGWCYANSLSNLKIKNPIELASYSENLAYLWLAIGLLVFFLVVGSGLMFSAAYAPSSGRL